MMTNKPDRRVAKTRRIIFEAFVSLMKEKPYDSITVQEIIDRADVGRSTFYSHFEAKDDLLDGGIDIMMNTLDLHNSVKEGDNSRERFIGVAELFQHIKENNRLIKAFIRGKSADLFADKVQSNLNVRIEGHLASGFGKGRDPEVPVAVLVNYISSTLLFLLKWWLDNKMKHSPAQMEEYFYKLVTPSVYAVLNGQSQVR